MDSLFYCNIIIALQYFVSFCCTIVNQPYVYIYPPPSWTSPSTHPYPTHPYPTHLGHHRELSWALSALQQLPTSNLCHTLLELFSPSVVSDSLWPHGLQHTRLPCPSLFPKVCSCSNQSMDMSQGCHPTISSSVASSLCPQSFPASGSFQMNQFFMSGGQSIGASASASALPKNIQDWFPLGLTGLISLLSKGLSRVFSSTTIWKHQFFST